MIINAEKYKNELRSLNELKKLCNCALRKDNVAFGNCSDIGCENCMFNDKQGCNYARMKWLLSEYKEPIKLTRFEYNFLNAFQEKKSLYLARDKSGGIFLYLNEPFKEGSIWFDSESDPVLLSNHLFRFVKWEDEQPTQIQEVVDNCEVVDDE